MMSRSGSSGQQQVEKSAKQIEMKAMIRKDPGEVESPSQDQGRNPSADVWARLPDRQADTNGGMELDNMIQMSQEAINAMSPNDPTRPSQLMNLGIHLSQRYWRSGDVSYLAEAIKASQDAFDSMLESDKDRSRCCSILSNLLGDRYRRAGNPGDLEVAIQLGENAIKATPESHPDWSMYASNLAHEMRTKYEHTGALTDISEAIRLSRRAVDATASHHPSLSGRLSSLGNQLCDLYLKTGEFEHLEACIRLHRKALDAVGQDDDQYVMFLNNFGRGLYYEYAATGAAEKLDQAIQASQYAVDSTPRQSPDWALFSSNLGSRLNARYSRTGAISDLEKAIKASQDAVDATPKNNPSLPGRLSNLGTQLSNLYSRTKVMASLDRAIVASQEALQLTTEDNASRAARQGNLAAKLGIRYSETDSVSDLNEAVTLCQEAVHATPKHDIARAGRLNTLANQLGARYEKTKQAEDLDDCIKFGQESVGTTPKDHTDWAARQHNLGVQLTNRYHLTKQQIALRKKMSANLQDQKIRTVFALVGMPLGDRHTQENATKDLRQAISCFESALNHYSAPIIRRLYSGRLAVRYCAILLDWGAACRNAEATLALLPKLMPQSLASSDRQYLGGEMAGLASDAAAVAANANMEPAVMLRFLEQARGIMATSIEEMRMDLPGLEDEFPELFARFTSLRAKLQPPASTTVPHSNPSTLSTVELQQRYEASQEFERVLGEIRTKSRFQDFLSAPNAAQMQEAAKLGPIVAINVNQLRSDAILVEERGIRLLPLPNLSFEQVQKKAKADNLGTPDTLAWLWDAIAEPVLNALGLTGPPSNDNWPRIWWIPTGPLSRLPLHAAGHHLVASQAVLDRAMSSYSSSIKTIIQARRQDKTTTENPQRGQALFVCMEDTAGHATLPSAREEISLSQGLCQEMLLDAIEPGLKREDVLSHLQDCKIFHFAGHAGHSRVGGISDPLNSYLLLDDGKLTVADVLHKNLRRSSPFFAYLSACGTGRITGDKYLDESIHLIRAYQVAGFRHVIGTLWEVRDTSCVSMAKITYQGMKDGGMEDRSVCQGLHNATHHMRNQWLRSRLGTETLAQENTTRPRNFVLYDESEEDKRLDWVPYVHFGV